MNVPKLQSEINIIDEVNNLRQRQTELERSLEAKCDEVRILTDQLRMAHDKNSKDNDRSTASSNAQKASEAKSRFLAHMSHEIRNPLNSIIGMTEILKECPLPDESSVYVQVLEQASENLLSLINDILDISKIESGEVEIDLSDVSLRSVIESAVNIMQFKAKKKNTTIEFNIGKSCPEIIKTDSIKLKQILTNLISNAVKFTENGRIQISVVKKSDQLEFCVKDTGIGIPKDVQKKIFESYTQAEASTTRNYGGTGLGLAIIKSLSHLMGGKVWLTSTPGEGSSFFFTVNLYTPTEESLNVSGESNQSGSYKPSLLIVEDEEELYEVFTMVFSPFPIDIEFANSPTEALEILKHKNFDTILSDFHMPVMTGLDLLKAVRESGNHVPFILMSGFGDKQLVIKGFRAGVMDVIEKPFGETEILNIVQKSLEKGRKIKESQKSTSKEKTLPELNILVAEDSKDNQFLLKVFLKNTPCHIDFCENGDEAVKKYKTGKYHLIFMDIKMPVMDGYEATKLIRAYESSGQLTRTPIIALSAHAFKNEVDKATAAGCDDYLTKPLRKSLFLDTILKYGQDKPK